MTTTTTAMNAAAATQLCGGRRRKADTAAGSAPRADLRSARLLRLAVVTRVLRLVRDHLLACSSCGGGGGGRYRRLGPPAHGGIVLPPVARDDDAAPGASPYEAPDVDDVVCLKVSLLGDCQIGKTSFMVKYVGNGEEQNGLQMTGLNLMDKTLAVQGARIAYSIWDVAGDRQFVDHVPIACKDAVAILYMFDLTSRCTLNNIIDWYERARKWNKTAIPILIGTKFDDFAQLPLEMQWTIVNQARAYARAMKATLFFSSTTHNINVNKIFKFITAKLFNLPWTVERNLTIGEPIIDF
ncbi:septum-promoting GTP-binding protein 1-like [Phragmites australis]|uniref:septum-promoting GTP-binding protein 1-like n=1 Tax=Phragmites australis TaxID=29695 RepID=UPI002D7A145C|nr:septum-promoting GTP-binding protein 1-like [Phragmites australis]XP_062188166.1 septum-promoting GTP-binding protein 1-like [Phragmites australis]